VGKYSSSNLYPARRSKDDLVFKSEIGAVGLKSCARTVGLVGGFKSFGAANRALRPISYEKQAEGRLWRGKTSYTGGEENIFQGLIVEGEKLRKSQCEA